MKLLISTYIVLLLAACTAQPSVPPTGATPAAQAATPASYAGGSAANTTMAFNGTWIGGPVQNRSKGSALPGGGEGFSTCPDYAPQNMTISDGLARFSALNRGSIYEGYVTPQGALEMQNGLGARFIGQIGSNNVARGRIIGTCVYELTWRKSA